MPSQLLIKFGQKVRTERLRQSLSQEQLAAKAGLHRTYIGMIERGEKNITLQNIGKITVALSMKLSDIFRDI
jgi:transcriptional regulator with XRE-family HTH domain